MKTYGVLIMQFKIILLLGLLVLTLSACTVERRQPDPSADTISVNEKANLAGEPAKVVSTTKGPVYAFSFDDKGQQTTCQGPVKLDENQNIVPQDQWSMQCSQPSIQELSPPAAKRELQLSSDALFDFGKSSLQDMKPKGRQHVQQFVKLLRNEYKHQPQLVLTGYTDRIGPPEANQKLALERAESVAQILERSGVSREMMTVLGKGSANPLVNCPGLTVTPELIRCLQPNRRVTVEVIGD